MQWEVLLLITQLAIFAVLVFCVYEYIKLRQRLVIRVSQLRSHFLAERKMDCDELIDKLIADTGGPLKALDEEIRPASGCSESQNRTRAADTEIGTTCHAKQQKRERLAGLVAGGQAKQYLGAGQSLTVDKIDKMSDAEIEKYYSRYEARLGAAMTKTLGQAALQLYI